jgi:hypothetical protein
VLARCLNLQHQLKIIRGVVAMCDEPRPRPILVEVDTRTRPDHPGSDQRVAVVDDQVGAANLPRAQGGQLGGQSISPDVEAVLVARCPASDFTIGPVPKHWPGVLGREVDYIPRSSGGQDPAHLLVPTSSPETKCRWNAKNTIVVGTAAISAPAATTFHDVV